MLLYLKTYIKCATYSPVDKAHLRLASAKAILRLSKLWDTEIPLDIFHLTLRTSEVWPLYLWGYLYLVIVMSFGDNRIQLTS